MQVPECYAGRHSDLEDYVISKIMLPVSYKDGERGCST